jgi:nicotinamidase-related amidase
VPVVFTVFSATHRYLDRTVSGPGMPNRYPDSESDPSWFRNGGILHELEREPQDVVIHKPSYGAFYDTPLETILKNPGRDTILICGTLTNYRCGMTARQGYERASGWWWAVTCAQQRSCDDRSPHRAESIWNSPFTFR